MTRTRPNRETLWAYGRACKRRSQVWLCEAAGERYRSSSDHAVPRALRAHLRERDRRIARTDPHGPPVGAVKFQNPSIRSAKSRRVPHAQLKANVGRTRVAQLSQAVFVRELIEERRHLTLRRAINHSPSHGRLRGRDRERRNEGED